MTDPRTTAQTAPPVIPPPPRDKCGHWIGPERRHCRATEGLRPYVIGVRCPLHTPARVAGRPEPQPGPGIPAHRNKQQA